MTRQPCFLQWYVAEYWRSGWFRHFRNAMRSTGWPPINRRFPRGLLHLKTIPSRGSVNLLRIIFTELTREQLGRMLFMNPDYIARLFREKQGISLNDYIRNRRISYAKTLLRETSLPLTEVCTRVGYAYNTYFFNVFKKATGLSPSEYRNKFRVHR